MGNETRIATNLIIRMESEKRNGEEEDPPVALCHSCDRCRARKTRCDGERPCGGCASKYMKKHKVSSIDGVPLEMFECVYSPAKRRGPVPGRQQGQMRRGSNEEVNGFPADLSQSAEHELGVRQLMLAQQAQALQSGMGLDPQWAGMAAANPMMDVVGNSSFQQQMQFVDAIKAQRHQMEDAEGAPSARRARVEPNPEEAKKSVPDTVAAHMHLLSRSNREGDRLRAYFRLSVDELFILPNPPSDEEYCAIANISSPHLIPKTHRFALLASRFAEVALGALVHSELPLAMELCNATVHCLRECVTEPVQPSYLFDVARAYFLLGVFRGFRGDMERYFKYRRVCMTYLAQVKEEEAPSGHQMLMAAISFHDAWAYLIHNANEKALPEIDDSIPEVSRSGAMQSSDTEREYNVSLQTSCIASDPRNKMWIQGAPPVYLNNEAPLPARSLDAIACAVRSCCDQANDRFADISKETDPEGEGIPQECLDTVTKTAVMAHENELCSRNMVLSAFALLQQHEASASASEKNQGHHVVISAIDAFLENGDKDGPGGFTDSQIQSLMSVCNIVIENPLILYHAGPTYHMVSNAAVLLCHLLNGIHAMNDTQDNAGMEVAVFDEILDTFLSIRKLLNIHRRKLPVKLRCHGIPRPNLLDSNSSGKPLIDLGNTLMCVCRGCQGFVLMACSPCVAAERARAANEKQQSIAAEEALDIDKDLYDIENEFDLDDDELLNMLSRIVTA